MALGYLVSLGNGQLGAGDVIYGAQTGFNISQTLGTGSWTWSGVSATDGLYYSNISDTGTYHLGTDGNVYFVPANHAVSDLDNATAITAPAYDDRTFGTASNNTINGDSTAEVIYGGATTAEGSTGNDTVNAGGGDDIVYGGNGQDALRGGGDSDTIYGGDGQDTIYGDNITPPATGQETLNWIGQGANGTDISNGFTQDTGGMRVTVNVNNDGQSTGVTTSNSTQYTASGETFANNSSAAINGTGQGSTSTTTLVFNAEPGSGLDDEVANVSFRINDVDTGAWRDHIIMRAFDAQGNPVTATLTAAGNDTVSGQSVTAGNGNDTAAGANGSVLVSIAGPVHSVQIVFANLGSGSQVITVTNVQFTTLAPPDGDDFLDGGAGNDTIYGGGGNDSLTGGTGNDQLFGGTGNDTLQGGAGNDTIQGGDGADTVIVTDGSERDVIDGGEGGTDRDTVAFSSQQTTGGVSVTFTGNESGTYAYAQTPSGLTQSTGSFAAIEALSLTDRDDTANASATTGGVSIAGNGGNDSLQGGSGSDTLDGGTGNDSLIGGAGNDSIGGGDGDDTVVIGAGDGRDTVDGGAGSDLLAFTGTTSGLTVTWSDSDTGIWSWAGGTGTFTEIEGIMGSDGDDTLDASDAGGPVTVSGGAGNDTPTGGAGDDVLWGDEGNDVIAGGAGNDMMQGGDGDDRFVITDSASGNAAVLGGSGGETTGDTLDMSAMTGNVTLTFAGPEAGTVTHSGGTISFDDIEHVILGSGDDSVAGFWGADSITAGAGADTIRGGAGNDTIDLGADGETDRLVFGNGDGDDRIIGFEAPTQDGTGTWTAGDLIDVSDLADAQGRPVNVADVAVTDDGLGNAVLTFPNGESLTLLGIAPSQVSSAGALEAMGVPPAPDFTVEGTSGDDIIGTGYAGDPEGDRVDNSDAADGSNDDLISGFGGDDLILAGDGNDSVFGGQGADTLLGQAGDDMLMGDDGDDVLDGDTGNDLLIGGGGADSLTGGEGDDTLLGGLDDDKLLGDAGNDLIYGGDGNDSAQGGDGDDTLHGGEGDDTLGGQSGNDTIYGGDGSDRLDGGTGDDSLYGGEGVDSIEGGQGNDIVQGGAGDDSINGAEGNDTVSGGAANDYVRGSYGNDTVSGGEGDDYVWGGYGDDVTIVENNFGNDTIYGDSEQETYGDTLDLRAVTDDLRIDLTNGNSERGSFTDGTSTATFDEIEHIILGSGTDTLVLADYGGSDRVSGFAAPVQNPDGTWTAGDLLDVSDLTSDWGTTPVTTADVVITDDGNGNATLTFPGGESLTLIGVSPAQIGSPWALNAMGIPLGLDHTVEGTAGDDVINAGYMGDPEGDRVDSRDAADGSQDDLIHAGAGNDIVQAGDGNDSVLGESGNDSLAGGTGNDTMDGGSDNDWLAGEDGDDSLTGGTGDDSLFGGTGNDTLDGGEGNDLLSGDGGDDIFVLRPDLRVESLTQDSITGGETDETTGDVIDATALSDDILVDLTAGDPANPEDGILTYGNTVTTFSEIEAIRLGSGNDSVLGSSGADSVDGGAGNDTMDGQAGADTLAGGDGDDTITFGQGDSISGGRGDDLFLLDDIGEPGSQDITLAGGDGQDTLDLGKFADLSTLTITSSGPNGQSGTVKLDDGSLLTFSEIENIICFTPGARIATPYGARPVETLRVGDMVITRDHGLRPIRWIGRRSVPATGRFAPIRIRPGAVAGLERDLIVSPQHRMLFRGYRAELLFGEAEVLVAARHLVDGLAVTEEPAPSVTYLHLLFDQHEIIYAEGAATESFHPGDIGLSALTEATREEVFTLFPELRSMPARAGRTARTCLKRHEAQLLRA